MVGNVPSPQQTPQTQTSFDASTNRINAAVMTGFSYDTVGNLTSDPTTPANGIVYDGENRQASYTKSVAGMTGYSYDGDGRRVKKVTGSPSVTTIYVYDVMGMLVAEYSDAQQQATGGTKYLTADHLGSTRTVTGQNQAAAARYDYLPFGEEISAGVGSRTTAMGYGGADSTRQKFTSKERDSESGLDYFLARYYSSAQGRFISPDEFTGGPDDLYYFVSAASENPTFCADLYNPQSLNKYQYCYNNPLRYVDLDGHDPLDPPQRSRSGSQGIPGPAPLVPPLPESIARPIADGIERAWNAFWDWASNGNTGDGSCNTCDQNLLRHQKRAEQDAQNKAQQEKESAGANSSDPGGDYQSNPKHDAPKR